jgi:hypothetical protein
MYRYRELTAAEINPREWRLAQRAALFAKDKLKIPSLELRFMDLDRWGEIESEDYLVGVVQRRRPHIALILGGQLSASELVRTVLHEAEHVRQMTSSCNWPHRFLERAADLFAREVFISSYATYEQAEDELNRCDPWVQRARATVYAAIRETPEPKRVRPAWVI